MAYSLADAFCKEDRVNVKFTDLYNMAKECTKAELLMNAVNCDVPHQYIREMATGVAESPKRNLDVMVSPIPGFLMNNVVHKKLQHVDTPEENDGK